MTEPRAGQDVLRRFWLVLTIACVVALTAINVYRAATQSITHDEAVTCERYARGPLYRLVSSTDANNHIIHSLLCRLTVGLCGPSELALRAPSLAGGLFFLCMLVRIGWRTWGPSLTALLAVLVLGLNPLVLDFLSIARGYSLALAFWAAALDQLLTAWQRLDASANPDPYLRRASRWLALAVLGNLTFALAAVALGVCWAVIVRCSPRFVSYQALRQDLWVTLVRPGGFLFLCFSLPLIKLRPGQFYFGAQKYSESLYSFVEASLAHHPLQWPWHTHSPQVRGWLETVAYVGVPGAVVYLAALLGLLLYGLHRRAAGEQHQESAPRQPLTPAEKLFCVAAGSLVVLVGLLAMLHGLIGMKLPLERTGLYLLPPFFLALLSGSSALLRTLHAFQFHTDSPWPRWMLEGTTVAVAGALCLAWACQLQTNHYRTWTYSCDSRQVFEHIVAQHEPGSKQRVRVGTGWVLAPCLNFYRDMYQADFIEKIERRPEFPADADIFIVDSETGIKLPSEPVVEIYRGQQSGVVVAIPSPKRIANAAQRSLE